MTDYIKGVDISIIQGNVDFAALAASGVQFVIIRCGVGNSGIDSKYAANVAAAKAAGLKVACYHFIYPLPPLASQPLRDPVKQAQFHFNASLNQLSCIDCEWPAPEDFAKWNCTPAQINQWMLDYMAEYTRLSNQMPIIYTYPYWAAAVKFNSVFAQYPLWIASYQATPAIPAPWTDWVLWQNTGGGGHLPTSGVPVDTDLAKDLSLWGYVPPPAPVLPPPDHQPDPPPVVTIPVPDPTPVAPPPVVAPPVAPTPDVEASINKDISIFVSLWNALMHLFESDIK